MFTVKSHQSVTGHVPVVSGQGEGGVGECWTGSHSQMQGRMLGAQQNCFYRKAKPSSKAVCHLCNFMLNVFECKRALGTCGYIVKVR